MTWLEKVLSSTEELESPQVFFFWSALSAISAIVKDHVYLRRGGAFKTFPNIYTLLVARSGARKGVPIALAKNLVRKSGVARVIAEQNSIQGILKSLAEPYITEERKTIGDCAGFFCASEFSASLINDPQALTILTDLYDRHFNEKYTKNLKSERFDLKQPTLTLLGGTNKAHFDDFIGEKDQVGGFIGRTFLITSEGRGKLNPLVDELENPPDSIELSRYLVELSDVKGEFVWGEGCKERFKSWYMDFYGEEIVDDTGTTLRIGDAILKVGMLLSLSRDKELTLELEDVDSAIKVCEPLVSSANRTVSPPGKSSSAHQLIKFMEILVTKPGLTIKRSELLRRYWSYFSADELDEIMRTAEANKSVEIQVEGTDIRYTGTSKLRETWERIEQRKKK